MEEIQQEKDRLVADQDETTGRRCKMPEQVAVDECGSREKAQGPKFFVNIEGQLYPWDAPTITTEEVAALGGWDPSIGVIEIDKDNNERTLQPGEVVELKPGQGFAKKIRFKRG
jgi:hypothetical protein